MSKRNIYIVLGVALLLLIGIFYALNSDLTGTGKKRFDWEDSGWSKKAYNGAVDQPYGARVFKELLRNYFPGKTVADIKTSLSKDLPIKQGQTSTYVFVGEAMYVDSLDTEHLKKYVKDGNNALIISKSIPFDLMSYIYFEECDYDLGWDDYQQYRSDDTLIRLALLQPKSDQLPFFYARQNVKQAYTWSYIPRHVFCSEKPQRPLGLLNDSLITFADFPYGNGHFYLSTTPIAFSNFHLLRQQGKDYCSGVLSHLSEGDFYWDDFSSVPEAVSRERNNSNGGGDSRSLPKEHLLSYLLEKEALAWFWYLLLGLIALYLIFRTQRRQRAIPVLPKNENSSYEFINTISNLHFRERNYQGISMQAMKLWMAQIRERYGLNVSLDPRSALPKTEADFFTRLHKLSQVPEDQIRLIFADYETIARFNPTEQEMIDFHLLLDRFWKQAK